MKLFCILIIFVVGAASCGSIGVTPYRQITKASVIDMTAQEIEEIGYSAYGYADWPIDEQSFRILVIAKQAKDAGKQAYDIWMRRARDLCNGEIKTTKIFRSEVMNQYYGYNGARPGDYELEGHVFCH